MTPDQRHAITVWLAQYPHAAPGSAAAAVRALLADCDAARAEVARLRRERDEFRRKLIDLDEGEHGVWGHCACQLDSNGKPHALCLHHERMQARAEQAEAEVARLRAVLEDYADASWYEPTRIGYDCGAVMDAGARARAALAAKEASGTARTTRVDRPPSVAGVTTSERRGRRATVASEPVYPVDYVNALHRQVATLLAERTAVTAERDRLREALEAVYEAFRDTGLDNSWTVADELAQAALYPAPPPGRTRPKDCSICRREDCTTEHACE